MNNATHTQTRSIWRRMTDVDFLVLAIAFSVAILAPFAIFHGSWGRLLVGDDLTPLMLPLYRGFYAWKDVNGMGHIDGSIGYAPYYFVLQTLSNVLPLWAVQQIIVFVLITVTFSSFYLLAQEFLSYCENTGVCHSYTKVSAAIASFLYTFNPYILHEWYIGHGNIIVAVSLAPLALLTFFKGLALCFSDQRISKRALSWLLITCLFSLPIGMEVSFLFLWFFLVLSFSMFFAIIAKNRMAFSLVAYIILYLAVFIAMSAWWGLPYFYDTLSYTIMAVEGLSQSWIFEVSGIPVSEILGLVCAQNFYQPNRVPSSAFYFNPMIRFAFFFVLIFSMIPLISPKKFGARIIFISYFAVLFTLGVFMVKGSNPPFGEVNTLLYEKIPFPFALYRDPFKRFMFFITLSLSVLFAFGLNNLFQYSKIRTHRILNPVIKSSFLILLIVLSYPFISGNIYAAHGIPIVVDDKVEVQVFKPYSVVIPDYYYDAAAYLNNQSDLFNIVVLPFDKWYASFNWGYTGGWELLTLLIKKPIANVGIGFYGYNDFVVDIYSKLIGHLYNTYSQLYTTSIIHTPTDIDAQILNQYFNVKYVLVLDDWNTEYLGGFVERIGHGQVKYCLQNAGFTLEKEYGNISVYKNNYWTESKYIYAAQTAVLVDSSEQFFEREVKTFNKIPLLFTYDPTYSTVAFAGLSVNAINRSQSSGWYVVPDKTHVATDYSSCPNATITYSFLAPYTGKYKVYANVWWDYQRGTLVYKIDNSSFSNGSMPFYEQGLGIRYGPLLLGESYLEEGNHTITFMNTKPVNEGGCQDLFSFYLLPNSPDESDINLSFEKVNPTQIVVHANASKPFFLVLGESFNPNWNAYVNGEKMQKHFVANGYANAWYIEKTGLFDVVIEYYPQKLLLYGSIISLTTLIVFSAYLAESHTKKLTFYLANNARRAIKKRT